MAQEYSGVTLIGNEITGIKLRVSFVADKWLNAETNQTEVEIIGRISYTLDGIEVDEDYIEASYGAVVAASAIERATDNALFAQEAA